MLVAAAAPFFALPRLLDADAPVAWPASAPLPPEVFLTVVLNGTDTNLYAGRTDNPRYVHPLTSGPGIDTDPALSPDRRTVIYVQQVELGDPSPSRLRVMGADGSGDRELFTADDRPCQDARRPTWEPGGRRMATVCLEDGRQLGIWVVEPDGSAVRQLPVPANADNPAWSASGTIAYSQPAPDEGVMYNDDVSHASLYIVDPDGGAPTPLTTDPAQHDRSPQWSPSGDRLLFLRGVGETQDAWIVDADGSNLEALTDTGDVTATSWSPTGEEIMFVRRAPGNAPGTVSMMTAEGAALPAPGVVMPGFVLVPLWGVR